MLKNKVVETGNSVENKPNDPLHGITLAQVLTVLRAHYSWKDLNRKVELNCFFSHPSIKSCLTFLRKNDWARKEVENLYLELMKDLKSTNTDGASSDTDKSPDTSKV